MFDIGWQELFLIAVVALVVIGPKEMPTAMRTLARALSKLRGLSREFQQGIAEIMREAELDEIRRKVDQAGRIDVKGEVGRMLDPDGSLRGNFDRGADLRPPFSADDHDAAMKGSADGGAAAPPPAAVAPRSVFEAPPAAPASSAAAPAVSDRPAHSGKPEP